MAPPKFMGVLFWCGLENKTDFRDLYSSGVSNSAGHKGSVGEMRQLAGSINFYRAMHFSAYARSWDRMSSVCPSVCDVGGL